MNDKQFDRWVNSLVVIMFALVFIVIPVAGIAFAVIGDSNKPTAPTYHCDGPGYPAPGTAEARACWIEESE